MSADSSEDAVQEFLALAMERDYMEKADPDRGKFRTFLLTCFKNFLAKEVRRNTAKKRGGDQTILSLDFEDAEGRFKIEPVDSLTPETIYERQWLLTVLRIVGERLRESYVEVGKKRLYEELSKFLRPDSEEGSYSEAANRLNMKENAIKVAVHRMRRRYGDLVREEVSHTLSDPNQIEEEIRHLYSIFSP